MEQVSDIEAFFTFHLIEVYTDLEGLYNPFISIVCVECGGSGWRRGAAPSGNADQVGKGAVLLVLLSTLWPLCILSQDAQPALPCHCV